MIKLTRIDDRLVHGQVAFTWTPALGIDCLLVANDKIAADEFQKMALGLAKPSGTRLLIKSIADAVTFLNDPRAATYKILILVNSVKDALSLAEGVAEIASINFGGLRTRPGAQSVSKAISLTPEDIAHIRLLESRGLELEVRQVPTDTRESISNLC
jgi:fructoselysine and glucoselysine-specific PTS system IIB component